VEKKPTLFEFYLLPAQRIHAFDLFEALLASSDARFMEIQSNEPRLGVMLHAYACDIESEKLFFTTKGRRHWIPAALSLRPQTSGTPAWASRETDHTPLPTGLVTCLPNKR